MTPRERFRAVLYGKKPDRLPMIEWVTWWDKTVEAWESQGMPKDLGREGIQEYFGLDKQIQISFSPRSPGFPRAAYHGAPVLENEEDYKRLKKLLYSDERIDVALKSVKSIKEMHDRGDITVWVTLEGFFWYPRTLFGIENHLVAFYDYPELMHEMNNDLTKFHTKLLSAVLDDFKPDFMTFAEDMSYNHGPMLSKEMFDEFLTPYYNQIVPIFKEKDIKVFIDTDGNVEPLIPWFLEVGIEGILPLERQAGVDVNRIRSNYPEFLIIGAYDKTIMHEGEKAMRAEFERILPAMKSGYYIPSVDHQTPPDVTLENYKIYVSLLEEYTKKAI